MRAKKGEGKVGDLAIVYRKEDEDFAVGNETDNFNLIQMKMKTQTKGDLRC